MPHIFPFTWTFCCLCLGTDGLAQGLVCAEYPLAVTCFRERVVRRKIHIRAGGEDRRRERKHGGTGKLHRPTGTPFFPQFKVCLSHWPSLSCPGTDRETPGPRAGVVISHDWPDVNRDNSEPSLLLTITMLSYEKWSLVAKARSSELYQFDWIIFSKMWKGVKNSSLCNSLSNIRFTAMSLHWKSQGSICHKLGLNKAISLYVYSNMSP